MLLAGVDASPTSLHFGYHPTVLVLAEVSFRHTSYTRLKMGVRKCSEFSIWLIDVVSTHLSCLQSTWAKVAARARSWPCWALLQAHRQLHASRSTFLALVEYLGEGRHKGQTVAVLGAGNHGFIGLIDILFGLFERRQVVLFKPHPIQAAW